MAIDLLRRAKQARSTVIPPESRRLADEFRTVKTVDECVEKLKTLGMLTSRGLSPTSLPSLEQACNTLRKDGMGLEPNLIGRAAVSVMPDHLAAGAAASLLARKDTDFARFADQGDRSRDAGDHNDAQHNYWRALLLYPSHAEYLLQYAHCLKERNLLDDAFVAYIDAFRFGASVIDVQSHAKFVATKCGLADSVDHIFNSRRAAADAGSAIDCGITSQDVRTAVRTLHLEEPSAARIALYFCKFSDRNTLISGLVQEARFLTAHRDLLLLLKETSGEIR